MMPSILSLRLILSAVISFYGCLIQSYYISSKYFLYETMTEIKVEKPDLIIIPDLFFCAYAENILFEKNSLNRTIGEIMNDQPDLDKDIKDYIIITNSKKPIFSNG